MKKYKFDTTYFLSQDTFIDWIKGDHSLDNYWHQWISEHPEATDAFNEACGIAKTLKIKEEKVDQEWIEQIKTKIDVAIDGEMIEDESPVRETLKLYPRKWMYYAASLVLIVCVSIFLVVNNNSDVPSFSTTSTSHGQKMTFYLEDGSKVKLNSASTLKYAAFSDSSRVVYLEGEAFFDVVKDSLRPFTVVTHQLYTQVLGTSFNVMAHREDSNTTVALVTGKVKLTDKNRNSMELRPGQAASAGDVEKLHLIDHDIISLTAWKDGIIMFDKASMDDVISELSKWYGVHFEITGASDRDMEWRYTGSFDNKSLQVVLMSLSYVKKFDYRIDRDTVYINYQKR